jgi:hypothetical protein
MKTPKILILSFLTAIGVLCTTSVFAGYFTVGSPGSTNGSFTITGSVTFGSQSGCNPGVVFDDGNGGIVMSCNLFEYSVSKYDCNAVMHGTVVNGVAQINSISLRGTTSVCLRIANQSMDLPWRLELEPLPVGSTYGGATVKGIGYMSPALFNCHGATAFANIGGGYISFSGVPGAGCFFQSSYNALTVTPSLNIVTYP